MASGIAGRHSNTPPRRRAGRASIEFNHAMIYTADLPKALAFYRGLLGFRLLETYPGAYARLRSPVGRTTIALHVLDRGRRASKRTQTIRLYFEVDGLNRFCRALVSKGVRFDQMPSDMPWGWRHAYLRDPDGHEISLYSAGRARLAST